MLKFSAAACLDISIIHELANLHLPNLTVIHGDIAAFRFEETDFCLLPSSGTPCLGADCRATPNFPFNDMKLCFLIAPVALVLCTTHAHGAWEAPPPEVLQKQTKMLVKAGRDAMGWNARFKAAFWVM